MTERPEPGAIVEEIRALALNAGAEIMKFYATDFTVERKDDASPVTDADRAADAIIVAGLAARFPDIPVVTEERAESHGMATSDRFFLVDPLDGTREFISRNGEFTVNIALIENGAPMLGVVYAPAVDRLFYTRGPGDAVEEPAPHDPGACRALSVSSADNTALRVVASRSHRDPATDDYIGRYAVTEFHSAGSSLKFCLIATGEADLYPRLGRTMEWDTAAGHAVLAAAGGKVDRMDGGTLVYGKPGLDNPHFIAYSPSVALIAA
ncbi:MAG: 3'(2'),5'-bisphosphate nucleotidase CysQ [Hyphomicrobiales bacterium]